MYNASDEIAARSRIELCIKDIKSWMTDNKLKLNDDKTELIIITSKYHQAKPVTESLQIASSNICASSAVRNLGAILIIHSPWRITSIMAANLLKSNQIRKVLDDDTAANLVHA